MPSKILILKATAEAIETETAVLCYLVIPLFHTGHESPELPRIDFLLIRGDS